MTRSTQFKLLLCCLSVSLFTLTKPASADSYVDYVAYTSSGSASNMGFTGDGRSLVVTLGSGCSLNYALPCYVTFTPPSTSTIAITPPVLTTGNGPGGYSVSTGFYDNAPNDYGEALYVSHDGVTTLLFESHWGFEGVLVNSFGDVAFIANTVFNGILGDSNVLAVNQDAPTPTPEPSALALLGTGTLAIIAMRRRKAWRVAHT